MTKFFFKLLFSVSFLAAICRANAVPRERRSDDPSAFQAVVDGHSQQLTQLTAQLTALQHQQNQLAAQFATSQKQVAFYAHRSTDPFSVAALGTLVFDVADLNLGNGFDTVSGVFTCPVNGLYAFFANCLKEGSTPDEDVGILVDGRRVAGCYTVTDGAAGMTVVHLQVGQKVFVHLYRGAQNVRGGPWNTFVGFLVKADVSA